MAITLLVDEQQFLVSSVAFVLALLVAQTRVESGIHSPLEVLSGRDPRLADRTRRHPGVRVVSDVLGGDEGLLRRARPSTTTGGSAVAATTSGSRATRAGPPRRPRSRRRSRRCGRSAASSSSLRARASGRGISSRARRACSRSTRAPRRWRSTGRAPAAARSTASPTCSRGSRTERFDLCVFGFWLSHVPEARFEPFWDTVRRASDRFFLVDSAAGDPRAPLGERRRAGGAAPGRRTRVRDREAALVAGRPGRASRAARLGRRPAHELRRQLRLRHRQDGRCDRGGARRTRRGRRRSAPTRRTRTTSSGQSSSPATAR